MDFYNSYVKIEANVHISINSINKQMRINNRLQSDY